MILSKLGLERPRSPWEVHAELLELRGAQVGNLWRMGFNSAFKGLISVNFWMVYNYGQERKCHDRFRLQKHKFLGPVSLKSPPAAWFKRTLQVLTVHTNIM